MDELEKWRRTHSPRPPTPPSFGWWFFIVVMALIAAVSAFTSYGNILESQAVLTGDMEHLASAWVQTPQEPISLPVPVYVLIGIPLTLLVVLVYLVVVRGWPKEAET